MIDVHEFLAKRLFMILSYGCFSLGFIFQCVGLWTPYWNDYSNTDMVYHKGVYNLGLWQSCYGRGNDTICSQFSVKGGVPAARLFQTLAFLTLIAIIVILILHRIRGQTRFLFIASLGCAITAVLIIIGVLSWVFSSTYLQYNLSWSFGLCILGALFCLLTSMLLAKERLNLLIIKSKRKVSTAEAMLSSTEKLDQPN